MNLAERYPRLAQAVRESRWLWPLVRQVAFREWCAIGVLLLALTVALGSRNGMERLDQTIYDHFASTLSRPARDDIIIIGIDDYSLGELGRWPWPRQHHADLVRYLSNTGARAIGFDIILSEPETSRPGDAELAQAIIKSGRVVLPVILSGSENNVRALMPIPELSNAAREIAHIHLTHDNDGVVRKVTFYRNADGKDWNYFALGLMNAAGDKPVLPVDPHPLIAFSGNTGHFRSVPYAAVMRGEVSPEFFRNKYVLIGALAGGLTDSYPTAVSGEAGAMPGVEIHANVLAGLLEHRFIRQAAPWQTVLFCMVPVVLALLCYLLLQPREALLASGSLFALTMLASYALLSIGVWVPPAAGLIVLVVSYPLWSWRRLEAAISYLGREFARLDSEPHLLPEAYPMKSQDRIEDVLEHRIRAMRVAARRVRDLRRFVSDSLDNLPDATLISDIEGHVLLANKAALDYFEAQEEGMITSRVPDLLSSLTEPQPLGQSVVLDFSWTDLLDTARAEPLADGVGASDARGRDLLVKSAPIRSANNQHIGWIVSVIDISPIRAAERSRDETLRFLSHDMRAPQASILAMLELQHDPSSALPENELFSRIEKSARKTLGLADNFVQLARAESHEYRTEEIDFHDVLIDATDEMWSLAKSKNIKLVTDIEDGEFPLIADRPLITRAIVNLISNAIKYSPENTSIECSLTLEETEVGMKKQIVCRIRDHGYGIAPADQARLFQRFHRASQPGQPPQDGIGLGLVFVKTVVERHHGNISFASNLGKGTTFVVTLPSLAEDGVTESEPEALPSSVE